MLALVSGVSAVLLVANDPGQLKAVLVEVLGLAILLFGIISHRQGRRLMGPAIAVAGVGIAVAAIGWGWIGAGRVSAQFELLPGMAGLLVLACGVASIRNGWERGLIMAGTAGLLVGVLTSGVVRDAPLPYLLAATVATVVAWDIGEQAVNLGEQVGTKAVTWPTELIHAAGSVVVGTAAVALAVGFYRFGSQEVPLAGLFLLLVGAVMLTAALYN